MNEFIKRRGLFWVLQFLRLGASLIGILTLGYIDYALKCESWYLNAMTPKEWKETP